MKTVKIDIIGSCVTRDAFEIIKRMDDVNNYIINNYISKASIISLLSEKIEKLSYSLDINKMTNWELRQIKYDLDKNWFHILKNSDSDIIIIDLIDERYDLYKINNSYITKSNILQKSQFKVDAKLELVKRNSIECQELWEKFSEIFIDLLLSLNKEVIIHKAFWKETYVNNKINRSLNNKFYIKNILYSLYYSKLGEFKSKNKTFRKSVCNNIKMNNNILNNYYRTFENRTEFKFIEVETDCKADRGHIWGLSPFHYEENYYKEFIKKLDKNINQD